MNCASQRSSTTISQTAAFRSIGRARKKLDRAYPVIHGSHLTRSGREEAYTLLHSLSLNNIAFHGLDEYPEHITAGAVLHGAWYTDPADIEADRAIFDLGHLSTWVDTSGLETKFPSLDGDLDGPYAVIKGHRRSASPPSTKARRWNSARS